MTDFALGSADDASTPSRLGRLAARIGSAFRSAMTAATTRHALDGLPDDLLKDVGLTRSEIPYVADAVAYGRADPTRDPLHYLNASITKQKLAR